MVLTSSLTVSSIGPKPIEAKQHEFLTSLLKGFSAGCSILKGLKPILNYNESFPVWLLGRRCGRAGRKGSGWWSWIMDVPTVPALVGCSESLGSYSGRAGEGDPSWLAQPPLCRFWLCPCGCRAWWDSCVPKCHCSPGLLLCSGLRQL